MAYLVRHAHAGDKHQWVGPDQDRPLSVAGQGEARGLLTRLGGYRISRILSGPAICCQQTVASLAGRFGLPVELTDDLAVNAAADQLLGLVTDPALGAAVLCSHGEVIGQYRLIGAPARRRLGPRIDHAAQILARRRAWCLSRPGERPYLGRRGAAGRPLGRRSGLASSRTRAPGTEGLADA